MKTNLTKPLLLFCALAASFMLRAQDTQDDKEVIIIEKTVDENGNVISESIRRNQGNLSEEQIQRMLEDEGDLPFLRSFDMEGMGFDDAFGNFFAPRKVDQQPRLGILIDPSSGFAEITEVQRGSGADAADIRIGDRILIVRGESVASVEDIGEALKGKTAGDKIKVTILRDGQELEKEVELKGGNSRGGFNDMFEFPMDMDFQFFGDGENGSAIMDSLMQRMRSFNFDGLDFDSFDMDKMLDQRNRADNSNNESSSRPQLGLLIDEDSSGITVAEVIEESSSDGSGIQSGDIITRFDDNVIGSFRELRAMMNTKSIGDEVVLTVERKEEEKQIRILLK